MEIERRGGGGGGGGGGWLVSGPIFLNSEVKSSGKRP